MSLTCVACKIMKSIIHHYTVDQLNNSASMSTSPEGRSCTTSLVTAFELWTHWIGDGYGVDIVYLDYSKALDSVDHVKLIIKKLFNISSNCKLIKWIATFIEDRKMRVKVKLEYSNRVAVLSLSGVPQGVSFGPLVFLIFENDLPLWIRNSMIPMFADDTKISRKITDVQDSFLLQEALDCLLEWSKYWHLNFNIEKCKIMRIQHIGLSQTEYELKLQEAEKEKDLEIIVTNDLKPAVRCAKATAKAMQVLGVIKRSLILTDEEGRLPITV